MGLVRVREGGNSHDTQQAKGSRKPRGWETLPAPSQIVHESQIVS